TRTRSPRLQTIAPSNRMMTPSPQTAPINHAPEASSIFHFPFSILHLSIANSPLDVPVPENPPPANTPSPISATFSACGFDIPPDPPPSANTTDSYAYTCPVQDSAAD